MSDGQVYLLDSEGLSQWVRGDRRMGARITDADRADIPVVTTSMTLVEAYHAKLHRPAWRWALSRLRVEPVTEQVADAAIDLLHDAGRTATSTPSTLSSPPWPCGSGDASRSSPPTGTTCASSAATASSS